MWCSYSWLWSSQVYPTNALASGKGDAIHEELAKKVNVNKENVKLLDLEKKYGPKRYGPVTSPSGPWLGS